MIKKKRFVNSVKVFRLSIKLIKPMQKYPHITESYDCTLKVFVVMGLFLINYLISLGICSTRKESK